MSISEATIKEIKTDPKGWAQSKSVAVLVKNLKLMNDKYFNTNEPYVSDKIYDILVDVLKTRDPNNKFLTRVGAPVTSQEVKLPYYMPSLDKIVKGKETDSKRLIRWINKYPGPYVLSDKLDGVSGLLIKNKDNVKLYTRGDGEIGKDISKIIKYIIPKKKIDALPIGIAIRGEIIMNKKNFKTIQKKYDLKNSRNTVSGIVNAKNLIEEQVKLTEFIGYGVLSQEIKILDQFKLLEKYEFPHVEYTVKKNLTENILIKYFDERLNNNSYDIDGIVVIDNSDAYPINSNTDNPDYGFAFKNPDVLDIAEATVEKIEWNASKDSYLVPTVLINPVELDEVTVNKATGFNAKFILDNKLGPGSTVHIIRSGKVIPYITDVIKGTKAQMPNIPTSDYIWGTTDIDIIYIGKDKKILNEIASSYCTFFFKKIGVKFLSEGTINKLVENGYNNPIHILDVFINNKSNLYTINGLGKTVVDKIAVNVINIIKSIKLEVLMSASNTFGRGLGSKKIKLILKRYPNILNEDWDEETMKNNIIDIKGFDVNTASKFSKNLKKFKKFYADLNKIINIESNIKKQTIDIKEKNKKNKGIFQDKTFLMTGKRNKEIQAFIEDEGGKLSSTVSKNTFMLIYSSKEETEDNNKYIKAKELGIKMMSSDEFIKNYMK